MTIYETAGLDIEALRRQVADDNFALKPHAMQHAVKEGFTEDDMVHVALNGVIVELYPERKRCLLYADMTIEGLQMPLHLVCEHRHPTEPVIFVTAYIPSEEEWETPTRRRKKR
jgi:hypothetical protein